jgi:hypothetical protein
LKSENLEAMEQLQLVLAKNQKENSAKMRNLSLFQQFSCLHGMHVMTI